MLGTSFNVEAFEKDDFVSTTLIEGKVRFDYMKNRQSTAVLMKPGQKLTYDSSSSRIQLIETNGESEIAWKDGKVVFHATPLPEALRMLEKRFNVTFVLSNERLRSEAFTDLSVINGWSAYWKSSKYHLISNGVIWIRRIP